MGPRSKRFKVWYLLTHQGSLEPVSMPRQDARLWMLLSLSGPWWSLVSHYHLGKTWASTWANLRSSAIPGSWEVQSSTAIYPAELNEKSCTLCFNLDTVSVPQWMEVPIQRSEKSVTEFPFFLKNFRPKRIVPWSIFCPSSPHPQHILSLSGADNMVLAAVDLPYSQFWEEAPNARYLGYIWPYFASPQPPSCSTSCLFSSCTQCFLYLVWAGWL